MSNDRGKRENALFVVSGSKKVGKTYRTVLEITSYAAGSANRKGRPVLVFDVNRESKYSDFITVHISKIHKVKKAGLYKVVPPLGATKQEMQDIALKLISTNFKDGLVVLDDFNKYFGGVRQESLKGAIISHRHLGIDIIIQLQNLRALDSNLWDACDFLRFHFQITLVDNLRNKEGVQFEILKIAQLILNEEYEKDPYFYIYIDLYSRKLIGINKKQFAKAAKAYLLRYKSELKNSGLTETKWINKKAKCYLE